jgi:diacylglycerol O-acyltransferase / wax synthase
MAEETAHPLPGDNMADPPSSAAGLLAGQPDELSPLDYLLYRGESYPATRSAFLNLETLDRPADWNRLREAMDRASRVVLRMRQKVVVPPVPVTPPRWVVDPDFDLDYHLRRVALPAPGTLRQLLDLAEVILQSPLDTSRALWEAVYVEGLDGDRAALLGKYSHAITDGLGGIALFEQVYDTEREPAPRPMPPVPIPRDLTGEDLLRSSLRHLPQQALSGGLRVFRGAAGAAGRLARRPEATAARTLGLASSARRMLGPPPAEPSPLLRRRSLMTRTHVLEVPLADLRAAAKAAGGSVNDAYLAALCGALGRYHEALGVPIDELPLALPVSLRTADDPAAGNRFAGAAIAAPIGEPDPARRIRLVREQVIERRSEPAIDVIGWIAPALTLLPDPALLKATERITPPDVQASNVPGYAQETFLAGARVERQYGLGPMPRVAMMAVLVSRAGTCTLTVRYDTASFTAADELEKSLQLGLDEVVALGRPRPRGAPSRGAPSRGAGARRGASGGRSR